MSKWNDDYGKNLYVRADGSGLEGFSFETFEEFLTLNGASLAPPGGPAPSERIEDADGDTYASVEVTADSDSFVVYSAGSNVVTHSLSLSSLNHIVGTSLATLSLNSSTQSFSVSVGDFIGGTNSFSLNANGVDLGQEKITVSGSTFYDSVSDSVKTTQALVVDGNDILLRDIEPSLSPVAEVSGTFSYTANKTHPVNTSSSSGQVTLTAGGHSPGDRFSVVDISNNASVNNVTINFGGNYYGSAPATVFLTKDGEYAEFVYIDATTGFVKVSDREGDAVDTTRISDADGDTYITSELTADKDMHEIYVKGQRLARFEEGGFFSGDYLIGTKFSSINQSVSAGTLSISAGDTGTGISTITLQGTQISFGSKPWFTTAYLSVSDATLTTTALTNDGSGNTVLRDIDFPEEFSDSTFRINDDADATKQASFDASSITTATTRSYTLPDDDGIIALTSDISNEFSDDLFRINDNTDATKQAAFEASAITTSTTRTYNLPDADGTLALTSDIVASEPVASEVSSATTALVNELLPVDVSSAAVTITAPSSPASGDWFSIADSRANAATNNISVDFTGQNYYAAAGGTQTLSANEDFQKYVYVDATVGWVKA